MVLATQTPPKPLQVLGYRRSFLELGTGLPAGFFFRNAASLSVSSLRKKFHVAGGRIPITLLGPPEKMLV